MCRNVGRRFSRCGCSVFSQCVTSVVIGMCFASLTSSARHCIFTLVLLTGSVLICLSPSPVYTVPPSLLWCCTQAYQSAAGPFWGEVGCVGLFFAANQTWGCSVFIQKWVHCLYSTGRWHLDESNRKAAENIRSPHVRHQRSFLGGEQPSMTHADLISLSSGLFNWALLTLHYMPPIYEPNIETGSRAGTFVNWGDINVRGRVWRKFNQHTAPVNFLTFRTRRVFELW